MDGAAPHIFLSNPFRALILMPVVIAASIAVASAQPADFSGFETVDVPLIAWVGSRDHAHPGTLVDFVEPPDRLAQFRAFSDALASSNWKKAHELATRLYYELIAINEADSWFVIASDDSKTGRGPIVVVNTSPRSDVIVEAPHVPFEPGTGEQALTLLRDLGGRAAIIAGAHRCASRTFASCSGKTAVCGTLEGYRDSDVGHYTETLFNAAHLAFAEHWPKSVVVSLHGMKDDNSATRIIISNGIHGEDQGNSTPASRLRLALSESMGPPGTVVDCNYPPDDAYKYRKLCGFTNVQGRHVNGAADTCRQSVDTGTGRFIHLEQGWSILKPYAYNWARLYESALTRALKDGFASVVPPISTP